MPNDWWRNLTWTCHACGDERPTCAATARTQADELAASLGAADG